ncbi:MAG: hypothetical protein MJE63_07515, partial [Proteobacteria bacterium]|nr:hypothetical protein [Pseudomonadota bacterium]
PKKPNRKMATNCRFVKLVLFLLLNMIAIASPVAESTMRPVYSLEGLKLDVIPKKEYNLKNRLLDGVFPVLFDNAIGTNQVGNALSIIKFEEKWYTPFGDGLSTEVLKKDFSDFISGSCQFRSAPSPNFITWVQTRRFFLYDLREKTHRYYSIRSHQGGWDYVLDYSAIDEQRKQYVFYIENYGAGNFLKIYDFSTDPPGESSLFDMSPGKRIKNMLEAKDGKIFLYNNDEKKLEAIDTHFRFDTHPIINLYNGSKDISSSYNSIKFHPTLPIALVAGRNKLYLAKWESAGDDLIPLIYFPRYSRYYDFSPDGNYAVVQFAKNDVEDNPKEPQYAYVFRVNPELDYVLDDPVELQSHTMLSADYLWTVNPTSFVKVSYENMFRWVIDEPKEAK